MKPAVDAFGRVHRSLRISVTDRCNLRCRYCMPAEGVDCMPRDELLTFDEIALAVDVAAEMGIDRVRITGGEPLLRRGLVQLVEMLAHNSKVADVAMTTNALLLSRHAEALADAGLNRVNISLDSLDPRRFHEITRYGLLETAWKGVEAATAAGFSPLRINVLLLDGFNDDEIQGWLDLTARCEVDVRFMELMPIGEGVRMNRQGRYVDVARFRDRLVAKKGLVTADVEVGNGPARYWSVPGAPGRIGFITPVSEPYCNLCSRMRLTSIGRLRPCLAFDEEVDLRPALREGDREVVREGFLRALADKPAGHHWSGGQITKSTMSSVGG